MANKIILKNSQTPGAVPTTSDIDLGELAINTYDGKMYMKKDDGTASIIEIGEIGSNVSELDDLSDVVLTTPTNGDILYHDSNGWVNTPFSNLVDPDVVVGPASATDTAVAVYDGTTGKLIKDSGVLIDSSNNIVPATNDVGALGTTLLQWADVHLASGSVINFNASDVTITHSANTLTIGGASLGTRFEHAIGPTVADGAALGSGSLPWSDLYLATNGGINFSNGDITIHHNVSGLFFAGAGAYSFDNNVTPTGSGKTLGVTGGRWDALYISGSGFISFDTTGDLRISEAAGSMTFTNADNYTFDAAILPSVNDGATLGTSLLSFSDLYLASGAVINFNAGDVTITHSADTLSFAGAADYDFDVANITTGGNLDVGDITCGEIFTPEINIGYSGLKINSIDPAYYLWISAEESLTADRQLNIDTNDGNRTLTIAANATISGTNTGDQDLSSYTTGAASSTDNALVRFDGTTGKVIQNSGITIDDTNNLTLPNTDINGVDTATIGTIMGVTYLETDSLFITDPLQGIYYNHGSGQNVSITTSSVTTNRNLNIDLNDGTRTLTIPGNATISGTNTGDQNIFSTIAVSGQSDVVADSTTDTLTFAAGAGMVITTNATTDTVTISQGEFTIGPIWITSPTGDVIADTDITSYVFRHGFTVTNVYAHLESAGTTNPVTIDINKNGTTILSTKLTIDAAEQDSATAAVQPVISVSSFVSGDVMTFDVDEDDTDSNGVNTAAGLSVYIVGTRA